MTQVHCSKPQVPVLLAVELLIDHPHRKSATLTQLRPGLSQYYGSSNLEHFPINLWHPDISLHKPKDPQDSNNPPRLVIRRQSSPEAVIYYYW
jgi:hypothetical protein